MGLDTEGGKLKRLLFILFLTILILGVLAISDFGLNFLSDQATANKEGWGDDLHYYVGHVYGVTFRPKQAMGHFEKHYQEFSEEHEGAALYYAATYAEESRKYSKAADLFTLFITQYRDHELHEKAKEARDRMKINKTWPRKL